ncbi:nitroreductase/quinone reductase family protein [Mycobacterium sp. C31M]
MSESTESNHQQEHTFSERVIEEFRSHGGKVSGAFEGFDILLLHNVDAKSTLRRISPVRYFDIDGARYILGSAPGSNAQPAWVLNIRANPGVRIELGGADIAYGHADEILGEARDCLLDIIKQRAPGFGHSEAATQSTVAVFELRTIRLSV